MFTMESWSAVMRMVTGLSVSSFRAVNDTPSMTPSNELVVLVAVTPLIGSAAVKGPTAKIMTELGLPLDVGSIVTHYAVLIDGYVLDTVDGGRAGTLGLETHVTNTLMRTLDDRIALAEATLDFCRRIRASAEETHA